MNDWEFKLALRGIDPYAPCGVQETPKKPAYKSPIKTVDVGLCELVGKADQDGYLWLDIALPDGDMFERRNRRDIDKWLAKNEGVKPLTLLQPQGNIRKQLVLSTQAKIRCSIDFKWDIDTDLYRIEIYAHLDTYFLKLGDKIETPAFGMECLSYELPFFAERPVFGLLKVKESDLVSAVQYALADSRLPSRKDCF